MINTLMEILIKYADLAFFAFVLTFILAFLALYIFPKIGLMDRPERYNLNRKPIPYYGGVTIFLAFLVSVIIFVPISKPVLGLLCGASLIAVVGFLDDLFSLKPSVRIMFHFMAGIILVFFGIFIYSINLPFLGTLDFNFWVVNGIPLVAAFFTMMWTATILNAMNFLDGVSGLTSGVSTVSALTIFALSIHPGLHVDPSSQEPVAMISLILGMCALAFFFFDFPKPRMLMGDTGSTFLGFMIATLAIFSGGKVATAFLVLGVVVLDMIWVVLRRVFSGQKFWKGDLKHLHHRLMEVGFSERKVVLMYLILSAIFGVSAVSFVSTSQKFFILLALLLLMFILAGALIFIPKHKKG